MNNPPSMPMIYQYDALPSKPGVAGDIEAWYEAHDDNVSAGSITDRASITGRVPLPIYPHMSLTKEPVMFLSIRDPLARFILMIAIALSAVYIAAPQPAQAMSSLAPTCLSAPSERTCDGQDPQTTGCGNNAYTIASYVIRDNRNQDIGMVEIRWSRSCLTNWTRTTSWVGPTTMFSNIRRINRSVPGWAPYEYSNGWNNRTQIWSPMVYAPSVYAGGTGSVLYRGVLNSYWTGWY